MFKRPPYIKRIIRSNADRRSRSKKRLLRDYLKQLKGNLVDLVARAIPRQRIDVLEEAFHIAHWRGLCGVYVEFGAYTGRTTIQAYAQLKEHWPEKAHRIIAFDSWEGLPPLADQDRIRYCDFEVGDFISSLEEYLDNITRYGVKREIVTPVKGWFEQTCTKETAQSIGLEKVSVVFFDCDIYSSTLIALNFIGSYLEDGALFIFDDWNCYRSHPQLGQRGALARWQAEHPDFLVTPVINPASGRASFSIHRAIREMEQATSA